MNAKIRSICRVAVLLHIFFLISISVADSASKPIKIVTFMYPPIIKCNGTGLADNIVKAAFQNQGNSVKFLCYPRKRSGQKFLDGEGQMLIGIKESFSEQEIDSEKILCIRGVFVYLKDKYPDFHINNWKELKGKKIGAILGSSQAAAPRTSSA